MAYNMLLNYDNFDGGLKAEFLARVASLINNRGSATTEEIQATSDLIEFAVAARFAGDEEGASYLTARTGELAGGVGLNAYLQAQIEYLGQLENLDPSSIPDEILQRWADRLRRLVNNVNESTTVGQCEQIGNVLESSVSIFDFNTSQFADLRGFIMSFESKWLNKLPRVNAEMSPAEKSSLRMRLITLRDVMLSDESLKNEILVKQINEALVSL